ncbi:MAG: NADH-quinone oxidoreductase subunit J [Thermoplasmata archaeon]|nr:NADH-quinone oxidoreductase subunit J [Thermoplasmata archaeon]
MSLEELAFLVLAGIAIGTALAALLVRELVHTILWISVFFVALSAIYFLLQADFLGILQLGVYAGAVTILLLFGVMVTRKRIFSREAATGIGPFPLALALVSVVILAGVASGLPTQPASVQTYAPAMLSQELFTTDGGWLVLLGLTMLSALAGAIYLVREGRE